MKAVFVDTGGWMACADQADPAETNQRQRLIDDEIRGDQSLTALEYGIACRPALLAGGIAVMRELKLSTVITTDRHFQQMGFEVLPGSAPGRGRKPRRPR